MVESVTNCEICHGPTNLVLDCGEMPLANGYAESDRREPLNVRWCATCDFYQLGHYVAPDTLFRDYAYRAGSAGQTKQFESLAMACFERARIGAVIDIGGNDGSLLDALGGGTNVDPYAPAQEWDVVRKPWGTNVIADIERPVDLICAANVWAHLPDLHNAAEAVAALLAVDGWFVIQAPWHRDLWLYNEFDTIYHEHRYYWGIRAVRALMQRHGMDVHDVEYLPNVHGGTLRYWVQHGNEEVSDAVERFADIERLAASQVAPQSAYDAWCHGHHREWEKNRQGALALGAPAKATMYWAMTNTAQYVSRVFDDATPKHNQRVPGTQLVIESFAQFPAHTSAPVVAMAWNAKPALTKRVRELGYTGRVL